MTVKQIESAIAKIRTYADADPEMAHGLRDELYRETLQAISELPPRSRTAQALARTALEAELIRLKWEACA